MHSNIDKINEKVYQIEQPLREYKRVKEGGVVSFLHKSLIQVVAFRNRMRSTSKS
jgi:hypothetical protein